MQRSLFTDLFFDFFFWFIFWFPFWFWLYLSRTIGILDGFCKWAALAFLRTIYVCKTIAYHMIISISAAASGNACKSVWNLFASKGKVKKIRVKDSVCIGDNPWVFWPSFCSRRLTERIIARLIYIHYSIIYIIRIWWSRRDTCRQGRGWEGEYRQDEWRERMRAYAENIILPLFASNYD